MKQDLTLEDHTILAALEALEGGSGEPVTPHEPSESAETLARLYTEVLGLVACDLEPTRPRPETRSQLLETVARESGLHLLPVRESPATPEALKEARPEIESEPGSESRPREAGPRPRPVPAGRPAPAPAPPRVALAPMAPRTPAAAPPSARRSRWPLALAASAALALAGLSGWLLQQRAEQEVTIESLRAELAGERRKAERVVADAAEARQSADRMRSSFLLVTGPAVTISPLRPVEGAGLARGTLFVAPDHQHWYMALHGLPPAAAGRDYQLWWVAGEGTVSGGTFDTRPGETLELSSETMPADTRDVLITLENDGGSAAPNGPPVLRAAGVYDLS